MTPDDQRPDRSEPVDFTPVSVGRRRRRIDPLAVGALLVSLGVALAVVKPWGEQEPISTASVPIAASPAPVVPNEGAEPFRADDPRTVAALIRGLGRYDEPGISVLVDDGRTPEGDGGRRFQEHWFPTAGTRATEDGTARIHLDEPIRALGLAARAHQTPLAIRAWALGPEGEWRWLDLPPAPSDRAAADRLLLPPRVDGTPSEAWPAGRYRLDLLMGAYIDRLQVEIDAPGSAAPDITGADRGRGDASEPTGDESRWPSGDAAGPYVVGRGIVRFLAGSPGPSMREAGAWLDIDGRVAAASAAGITGMGVLLPAGAHEASGTIRRLAPAGLTVPVPARTGIRPDPDAPAPYVRFDAPSSWPAGVYALEVAWRDPDGLARSSTWHIDLHPGEPGEPAPPSALLAAARRYANHAGTVEADVLVLGAAAALGADAENAPVRVLPMGAGVGCDETVGEGPPDVLGLALARRAVPGRIQATLDGPLGGRRTIDLRVARDVVPGLTLLAPTRGAAFPAGIYRIGFDTIDGRRETTLCLGIPPAGE